MRQPACLDFNPIMVDNYAAFFIGGSDVRLYDGPDLKLLGLEFLVCCLAHRGSTCVFVLLQIFIHVVWCAGFSITG